MHGTEFQQATTIGHNFAKKNQKHFNTYIKKSFKNKNSKIFKTSQ